ncbi:MAG: hypothetical protein LBG52_07955 [Candidatus Peribacteria bacterium]|nr:hypothetical protein [Candidatus Peribacteria bacterium]
MAFSFFVSDAVGVSQKFSEGWDVTLQIFLILLPVIVIRGWITFFFQKQIMFSFSGAKEVSRVEYPQVYNIVENLCISRGILMPKV